MGFPGRFRIPATEAQGAKVKLMRIYGSNAAIVLHESATSPLQGVDLPSAGDVVVIVGPEGGLTEEELTVFAAAGAVPVRLGPQVLRTSTAGAVVLGALGVLTGRWT